MADCYYCGDPIEESRDFCPLCGFRPPSWLYHGRVEWEGAVSVNGAVDESAQSLRVGGSATGRSGPGRRYYCFLKPSIGFGRSESGNDVSITIRRGDGSVDRMNHAFNPNFSISRQAGLLRYMRNVLYLVKPEGASSKLTFDDRVLAEQQELPLCEDGVILAGSAGLDLSLYTRIRDPQRQMTTVNGEIPGRQLVSVRLQRKDGWRDVESYVLLIDQAFLGSDPALCSLSFPELEIEPMHLRLIRSKECLWLENMTAAPVHVVTWCTGRLHMLVPGEILPLRQSCKVLLGVTWLDFFFQPS